MSKGLKRGSPGAETEKNPIPEPELGEEDAAKLRAIANDIQRAELILERRAQATLGPVYDKRREILKSIPHFWPIALMNHTLLGIHAQHHTDRLALSYLEDLYVVRDKVEPKVFTLEFYFKENPFFSDAVLRKEFRFVPSNAAAEEKPDEDGITPSMMEFSWERDVVVQPTEIHWKDDSKNLTKVYPQVVDEEGEVAEYGSFFNFFTSTKDVAELGVIIANEVYPDAIDFFEGNADDDITDDDEDSEDDDDAEEIDLEKPRKKAKQA